MSEQAQPKDSDRDMVLTMASSIVAAYLARNEAAATAVPEIITSVFHALNELTDVGAVAPRRSAIPAVSIAKSVTPDYLVCLEDGRKLKMLKRHLRAVFNMTPDEYRAKWGLPRDYPMVAASYATRRSELAKTIGLGKKGRGRRRVAKRAARA
jgi:predicted transcriptional regulator